MKLIDFLFYLVDKNVSMDTAKKDQLKTDALAWQEGLKDYKPDGTILGDAKAQLNDVNEFWGFRLFLALASIPALKFLRNYNISTPKGNPFGAFYGQGSSMPPPHDMMQRPPMPPQIPPYYGGYPPPSIYGYPPYYNQQQYLNEDDDEEEPQGSKKGLFGIFG